METTTFRIASFLETINFNHDKVMHLMYLCHIIEYMCGNETYFYSRLTQNERSKGLAMYSYMSALGLPIFARIFFARATGNFQRCPGTARAARTVVKENQI